MPRTSVSRERLIELIKERISASFPQQGELPAPLPIPVKPVDGEPNWKIDQVVGVPSGAFNAYMRIIHRLMEEYELSPDSWDTGTPVTSPRRTNPDARG